MHHANVTSLGSRTEYNVYDMSYYEYPEFLVSTQHTQPDSMCFSDTVEASDWYYYYSCLMSHLSYNIRTAKNMCPIDGWVCLIEVLYRLYIPLYYTTLF